MKSTTPWGSGPARMWVFLWCLVVGPVSSAGVVKTVLTLSPVADAINASTGSATGETSPNTFAGTTTGTGSSPRHTYTAAGTDGVRLTVTDEHSGSGSASTTVTVTYPEWRPTTQPPGVYSKVGPRTPIPGGMKANLGIVGFEVDPHWDEFETQDNVFSWAYVDGVLADAKASGLKVIISIQMSLVFAPRWVRNGPRVHRVTVLGQTVPVYWDPIYQAQKTQLIRELGRHVAAHPEWADTVVGIKVGVANFEWNELTVPHDSTSTRTWLNAGYSTTRMLTETVMFDAAAAAFPAGAVRFAYHGTSAALDGTQTRLSERFLAHGHGHPDYGPRFYSQIDFLSTEKPYASDPRVTRAQPGEWNYIYKLLTLHQPNIGLEMVDSAALGPATGCWLNHYVSPCDPIPVLQKAFDIGLSYRPRHVTVWQDDGKDSRFASIFEEITCRLGGTLRGGKPCPRSQKPDARPDLAGTDGATPTPSGSASGGTPPPSHAWTFGDGTTGSSPSHTYTTAGTHTVRLTTPAVAVAIALPGRLTANAGPDQFGNEGATLRFNGSASGGTSPYAYAWTFGDGTTGSGASVTHVYPDNGPYVATLTVTDARGLTARDKALVRLANVAPTGNAGAPYTGTVGTPIAFRGSATDPGAADVAAGFTFVWSFGDGASAAGATARHAYAAPGTYTVTLRVTDKDGGAGTATTSATLTDRNATTLVLTAAGDYGDTSMTNAVLDLIPRSGSQAHFALGDLSYGSTTPESAWCGKVKARVGATFPFELVSGNHEDGEGSGNNINGFIHCLPNRLPGLVGQYGKEWYVDIAGLARLIMIGPNLSLDGHTYDYTVGSAHYSWLANAIDGARAAGLRWVIVGMHEVCITVGVKSCEIGTDLQNLLVRKRVDLILQAHDHTYQRSKQLALGAGCAGIPTDTVNAACIADDGGDDGQYAKGAGSIIAIVGTGGRGLYSVSAGDEEAGYFVRWTGANVSPSWGILRLALSPTELVADFLPAVGSFTDHFEVH